MYLVQGHLDDSELDFVTNTFPLTDDSIDGANMERNVVVLDVDGYQHRNIGSASQS